MTEILELLRCADAALAAGLEDAEKERAVLRYAELFDAFIGTADLQGIEQSLLQELNQKHEQIIKEGIALKDALGEKLVGLRKRGKGILTYVSKGSNGRLAAGVTSKSRNIAKG